MTQPTLQSTDDSAALALLHLINGGRISQLVGVAAQLGLADLVTAGGTSSTELAAHTGTHAPSLYRLLRALSSVGVFSEDVPDHFSLTPLADLLRTEVPGSLRAWAIFSCDPQSWLTWGGLAHSVQTGETAFRQVFGMDVWAYRAQHPEANAIFNAAMTARSGRDISAILAAYDFTQLHTLIDVGGGHGTLITGILQAHPALHGLLFDLPHVVAGAAAVVEAAGVADRCELVSGNFFEAVPGGADAYLLRRILHDWDDDRSTAILQTCHHAMPAHAKLLLVEGVIQPSNRPDWIKVLDIEMLVAVGGRERTEAEWQLLLARGGFALTRVHATTAESCIIEGTRR